MTALLSSLERMPMNSRTRVLALIGAGAVATSMLVATASLTAQALTGFAPNAPSVANIPDGGTCDGTGRWIKLTSGGTAGSGLTANSGTPKVSAQYDNIVDGGDQTMRIYQFRNDGSTVNTLFSSVWLGIASANPVWTFPATLDTNTLAVHPLFLQGSTKNFSQFAICSQDTAYLKITKNWVGGPAGVAPNYVVNCDGTDFDVSGPQAVIEAKAFLAGLSCTITETAIPGNGWIEDSAPKTLKFADAEYDAKNGGSVPELKAISFTNTKWSATKTATGSTTNTYAWTLVKTANPTSVVLPVGGSADVTYTITPTRTGPTTVSAVAGAVTVTNVPAGAFAAGSVTVSDPAPLNCTGTTTLVCTYTYAVGSGGTNTATVTYSANGDTETLSPTAEYTLAVTNIDDTATLTDTYDGGAAKTLPTSKQTYTKTFSCAAPTEGGVNLKDGESKSVLNTATLDLSTSTTDIVATATVDASCGPLTATKTATATYTDAYDWTFTKTVDQKTIALAQGATGAATYTVVATRTGPVKTNIAVSGSVKLTNGGTTPVTVTAVTDTMAGLNVPLTCPALGPLAPKGVLTCTYNFPVPGTVVPPTNSVVFTTSVGSVSAEQPVVVGQIASTRASFVASDVFNGGEPTALGEGSGTKTFTYVHTFTCGFAFRGSQQVADGATTNFPNVATLFLSDESSKDATAAVDVSCAKPEDTTTTTTTTTSTTTTTTTTTVASTTTTTIVAPTPPVATLLTPVLVPPTTTTGPPTTTTTTTTTGPPTIPASVLAEQLSPPTIKPVVLSAQIVNSSPTPAFTGANDRLLGLLGAACVALGGGFVTFASRRRRQSA